MNILHAKKYNKKWETSYEGKCMFIQTEYSLHYKVHYKKLVQELSTSYGGPMLQELSTSTSNKLATRSTSLAVQATGLPGWSDRQSTKKAVRADSLEHSPPSHQALDKDL